MAIQREGPGQVPGPFPSRWQPSCAKRNQSPHQLPLLYPQKTARSLLFANARCNQEDLIDQLKNGLNALRMPTGDLVSNWAYMVIASLAWTLKAWFALMTKDEARRDELLAMEFKRFLHWIVRVPCQIVRTGRKIVYRFLGYTRWLRTFFDTFERIRRLRLA